MRYIPHTQDEIGQMLDTLGVNNIDTLFDCIPAKLRLKRPLELPAPLDEQSLSGLLSDLAADNPAAGMTSFIGAGAYAHHVPAAVDQLLLRGEFFTAYTPYQPEVSQGTLQAVFEYQSMIAELFGCEVVNASMYDGATAAAEALLMALRIKRKRQGILVARSNHPEVRSVCETYLGEMQARPEEIPMTSGGTCDLDALESMLGDDVAAVLVQQPNALGCLEDLPRIAEIVQRASALLVVSVLEPFSLGLLEAPVKLGADIVCGEGMGLGSGLNFGGPGLGLFGCSKKNVWQMPGRLVGETTDDRGRRGYVLTMSSREQHIRRARATSNICSNEGLCALAAAIHLSLLGKRGFVKLAEINAANARAACSLLGSLPGVERAFDAPFFNEFTLRLSADPEIVLRRLESHGILGGIALGRFYSEFKDCLLVCVTELNTESQLEALAAGLES
jgi:glycine dehydrogenase subunit 1